MLQFSFNDWLLNPPNRKIKQIYYLTLCYTWITTRQRIQCCVCNCKIQQQHKFHIHVVSNKAVCESDLQWKPGWLFDFWQKLLELNHAELVAIKITFESIYDHFDDIEQFEISSTFTDSLYLCSQIIAIWNWECIMMNWIFMKWFATVSSISMQYWVITHTWSNSADTSLKDEI